MLWSRSIGTSLLRAMQWGVCVVVGEEGGGYSYAGDLLAISRMVLVAMFFRDARGIHDIINRMIS